jgi:glycosyltransferase involved in cell wall biosynthesis
MRVLMVSPSFPLPARRGEQVIVMGRLRELQRLGAEIDLVCLSQDSVSELELGEVRKYCQSVRVILVPKWHSRLYAALAGFFTRFPMQVAYFFSFRAWFIVQLLLRLNRYDAVHVMLVRMAPMVRGFRKHSLIEMVDSMALNVRSRLGVSSSVLQRLIWRSELRRIEKYENQMLREFGAATVVSKRDKEALRNDCAYKVHVLPNGVDPKTYLESDVQGNVAGAGRFISFIGNLSYRLNVEAIKWFAKDIFPQIRSRYPDLKLRIVGANPLPEIRALDSLEGIELMANVSSVEDSVRGSVCTVVPLLTASGLQNKIIESLAFGIPVVSSPAAADGLPDGCKAAVRVARELQSWCAHIGAYLESEHLASIEAATGRSMVLDHCSWEKSARQIVSLHRSCEPVRHSNEPISASSPFVVWTQLGAMRSK